MKQQTIEYLAFDVHQATIVAVARDERGSIVLRATIPTEARAIVQLVKSAGPRVQVAFEEEWIRRARRDEALLDRSSRPHSSRSIDAVTRAGIVALCDASAGRCVRSLSLPG